MPKRQLAVEAVEEAGDVDRRIGVGTTQSRP
jgi:hypothetical protein